MAGILPFDQISKRDLRSGMARVMKYAAERILKIFAIRSSFSVYLFKLKLNKYFFFYPESLNKRSVICVHDAFQYL